jgi:hypothetical protein
MPLTTSSTLDQVIQEINDLRNAHTALLSTVPNIGHFNALRDQVNEQRGIVEALRAQIRNLTAAPTTSAPAPVPAPAVQQAVPRPAADSAMPPALVESAIAPSTPPAVTSSQVSSSVVTLVATPSASPTAQPTAAPTPTSTPASGGSAPATPLTHDALRAALRVFSAIHGIPAAQALLARVSGRTQVPQVPAEELARVIAAVQAESRVG